MMNEHLSGASGRKPICVGTGLISLDIITGHELTMPVKLAGGSCGNVLSILAYLHWKSYPIARLKDDSAAKVVVSDMQRWYVNTSLVYHNSLGTTPIIIQRNSSNSVGDPKHRYEFTCPQCGSWLPRYRPVPKRDLSWLLEAMPVPQVFYFDRVSASSVILAQKARSLGALIVFEPSSLGDQTLFLKCVGLADIVKFAHDRFDTLDQITRNMMIPLEVQTLGARGLRYRCTYDGQKNPWEQLNAFKVQGVRDTAGAGDWCTAGLIHHLGRLGRSGFQTANPSRIQAALQFGQMLAAVNCKYEGARGCMYHLSRQDLNEALLCIQEENPQQLFVNQVPLFNTQDQFSCPQCPAVIGIRV
jgi:fructokinase